MTVRGGYNIKCCSMPCEIQRKRWNGRKQRNRNPARMKKMKFDRRITDEIYTSDTVRLGKNAFQAMRETIYHNGGVGTITGYYDAELSILSVSDLLLHNLNHSYESLMEQTKGSLKNLFYKKDATFLDNARFRQIQGGGESQILTADGSPVYVRIYKSMCVSTKKMHSIRMEHRSGSCQYR